MKTMPATTATDATRIEMILCLLATAHDYALELAPGLHAAHLADVIDTAQWNAEQMKERMEQVT